MNISKVRNYLQTFEFKPLFFNEVGWDRHKQSLTVTVGKHTYDLDAVAEKKGMVAFVCAPDKDGFIPLQATRRKIEHQVAQTVREHIIIYTDAKKSAQVWQWVRREKGKPVVAREVPFYANTSGDLLIQKLRAIKVELDDENDLTLVVQTGRVRQAFDVEAVTTQFYRRFKDEHARFLTAIQPKNLPNADLTWYTSVMLNRLMFLYFVQRKGFLAGDENYLRNRLQTVQREQGNNKFFTFYRHFLMRLFHEGLGQPTHDPELKALIGNIPYLNGGLFAEHAVERKCREQGIEIQIEDAAFERVFAFFDEFDWHLDNRPTKAGNEINPDVLGYIFEKYINFNEAGQKENGAYYTKEDITEYISRNTILPYLLDVAREKCRIAFENEGSVWRLLRDNPDKYIFPTMKHGTDLPLPPHIEAGIEDVSKRDGWNKPAPSGEDAIGLPTELWREVVARRQRCTELRKKLASGAVESVNDLITLNLDIRQFVADIIAEYEGADLIQALWRAIKNVRVLDPTVGSGAFLFAALNILEPLYEQCLDRMETFVGDVNRAGGANMDAMYRAFRDELAHVNAPQHTNRTYFIFKSIIVNNLFGVDIMEEATEICKLRLFLKLVAQVEPDTAKPNMGVEPLPNVDFNIRAGNTLVGYVNEADRLRLWTLAGFEFDPVENLAEMLRAYSDKLSDFRKSQLGQPAAYHDTKEEVERAADLLRKPLDYDIISLYETGKTTTKPTRAAFHASHAPLHWFIEFPEVMAAGGFDAIIGNPPWVEFRNIGGRYDVIAYQTRDTNNLWALISERALQVLKQQGRCGLIVPMALTCTERMLSLQNRMSKSGETWIANFESDSNPGQLFQNVKQNVSVCLHCASSTKHWHTTRQYRFFSEARNEVFFGVQYAQDVPRYIAFGFPKASQSIENDILKKLFSHSPLSCLMAANGGAPIYVHRIAHYYIKGFNFVPYFRSDRDGVKKSEDYKPYFFPTPVEPYAALVNSSTFYFYWQVFFDSFKAGKQCVEGFPCNTFSPELANKLEALCHTLMDDMRHKSTRLRAKYIATGDVEYDQFYPRESKSIIDKIDRALAAHYGFTGEELDFIINYDIKYRMGRGGEGDGE